MGEQLTKYEMGKRVKKNKVFNLSYLNWDVYILIRRIAHSVMFWCSYSMI